MTAERAANLAQYLLDNPTGLTRPEMAALLGCSEQTVQFTIQELRDSLADIEGYNLICEPDTTTWPQQPWIYRLVNNLDDARWWARNRLRDSRRRIETQRAVMSSVAIALDRRTVDGRKAHAIEVALRHLSENLQLIDLEEEAV